VEATSCDYTNILIGISDTDFEWNLQPKETFTTPSVCSGYTVHGFTGMSHLLSSFARNYVMPQALANKPLPVLYNSWYSTLFDVRCDDQIALAEKAAELGIELFVIDDGWFAGRKDDTAGLGDWYVDKSKFPDGLIPLIQRVNELGMKFGLWIEPEMTNPDSDLYRNHPDWIYQYKTREIKMGRNQYMLDLTNPEIIQYLIDCFDKLLSENNIEYIKWDMNRYMSETACASLPTSEFKSISYRNTLGVYQIIQALRTKHPDVEFEACASGGGRVDYGSMQYFDEYWPSDNTDPLDRLYMQESYSYLYPIKYMRAWLTDDCLDKREVPLGFFMHSAMCGVLGIGTNINETEPQKLNLIKEYIRDYKEVRNTVQTGKVYRLLSLHKSYLHAVQYVSEQQSVTFIFLLHEMYGKMMHEVKFKGLDADALYRFELDGCILIKSGAYLMGVGLSLKLTGDYASKMLVFEKTE
jgi:alpha-galactosidase